ncbi:isochorismatase family protein [Kitasatospora purpeofusca]|uniref:isochorismatase family protein n=1 Tax=Kitasatospora purpeofusca TaxID=67352 RepID=UPI000AF9FBA4|nr:isochorismatase family protein [Kitasatospora purpeofusca]MCX4686509.1 isochorismatase family protein [Kitasatospora purpeofusca]MCX4753779.1 isochorismatase family protein [Kitasatospora purpeofusca]WSR33257.1 isochorismatase family protein [Kitasatospora purpeofusca]WSR41329.1 isochorismatase family protein [Kitasatospora purpeofusca]WTA52670.1 isochorismatase family protein [Kitasatospora purpeofusca]
MTGIPPIQSYPLPAEGELPPATVSWTAEADRAVLLVHDMQRYFLESIPESTRNELVGNAARLRDRCAGLGVPVAYTAQPGGMTDEQRGLLKDFWGPGMRPAPEDRQVVDALAPAPQDWLLTKWRYSAFFRTDLLERMRDTRRDQLVLCGVYAHVGVLATAIEAFTNDIQVFFVADATADFSAEYHRSALKYAAERCARVTTVKGLFG